MPPLPDRSRAAYWRVNLRFVGTLLFIWFMVSFGAGIIWADALDTIRIPGSGFGLGFWFAQQGSIYVFVILIFVYVAGMNRIDRTFGVGEDAGAPAAARPDLEDPDSADVPRDPGGQRGSTPPGVDGRGGRG